MFPVLRGGVIARAAGVFFKDMDVLAGEPWATLVRGGSCSPRSWMRRFGGWAGTFAGRSAEW